MELEDRIRQYCDQCLHEYRQTQTITCADARRAKLKELRAAGIDPSHTGEASEKRSSRRQQRKREEAAWGAAHPDVEVDEEVVRSEILPGLQGVMLSTFVGATELSHQYCSLIRRGPKVPHPRHWSQLRKLAQREEESVLAASVVLMR